MGADTRKRQHKSYEIINVSNGDLIPGNLKVLETAVIEGLNEIYGKKLVAVYGVGSLYRGKFTESSDADFYAVVSASPEDSETSNVNNLMNSLDVEWAEKIQYVDIGVVSQERLTDGSSVAPLSIAVDGVVLWGREQEIVVPGTINEVVWLLNKKAPVLIAKNDYFEGGYQQVWRRRLAKIVLRLAYANALMGGAPLYSDYSRYVETIKEYAEESYALAKYAFSLVCTEDISTHDAKQLIVHAEVLLSSLREKGVDLSVA